MSAHSPGPWRTHVGYVAGLVVLDRDGKVVARIAEHCPHGETPTPLAANAKLIAAAPTEHELLVEALDLVPCMSEDDPIAPALADWCRKVRAAIAEATS